jgi:hypothetical protein
MNFPFFENLKIALRRASVSSESDNKPWYSSFSSQSRVKKITSLDVKPVEKTKFQRLPLEIPTPKTQVWRDIVQKIEHLRKLDRCFIVYGADKHRYMFGEPLSEADVIDREQELGITLPEMLRSFYLELGNGGVGPYYGIEPIAKLWGSKLVETYPGYEGMTQHYLGDSYELDTSGNIVYCFDDDNFPGLLLFIKGGNPHYIVVNGEYEGKIITTNQDCEIYETGLSLYPYYNHWLNKEIKTFETIKSLMFSNEPLLSICDILGPNRYNQPIPKAIMDRLKADNMRCVTVGTHMASMLNIPKGSSGLTVPIDERLEYYGNMLENWRRGPRTFPE